MKRPCSGTKDDGSPCRAAARVDGTYCFHHDPESAVEAAAARRLGGLRRRREGTISTVYDLAGLGSAEGIRRVLDIAVTDALGLDNGVARLRVLISAAVAATRLLMADDHERRLGHIEVAIRSLWSEKQGSAMEEQSLLDRPPI